MMYRHTARRLAVTLALSESDSAIPDIEISDD